MFLLPAFLAKFAGHDVTVNKSIWGPMYDGSRQCSLSPQETRLREQISTQVMSKRKAQRIVSEAAHLQVWPTRIQFIEALAALSSLHPGEMHRKLEGSKTTVVKMLHSLASSEKVEWLFNSLRYRHGLPFHVRMLLPSGTTANEALHAELNNFFRQIQSMHLSTLSLKLNILRLGKLMSHNLALFRPTARQMPGAHVLARRLGKPVWTKDTWLAWVEDGRKNGESLPYKKRRLEEQRLTSRKSPAASRKHVSEPSSLCHGTATSEFEEAASKQNLLSGRQNQVGKEMTVDVSIPMFDHCSKVCSTLTHGIFGPNASNPLCEW